MAEKKFDKDINVRSKDDTDINIGMTDEEIVKALENKKEDTLEEMDRTGNCLDDYIVGVDGEIIVGALDLIHRLQEDYSKLKERYVKVLGLNEKVIAEQKEEIERLTEKYEDKLAWQEVDIQRLTEENKELYKENTTLIAGSILERKDIAKDTAKEILVEAKKWVKEHYKDKVTDSFGEREMLFMEAFGCLFEYLKEKYGVEVE